MLYKKAKIALILTSFSPIIIVFGINEVIANCNRNTDVFNQAVSVLIGSIIIFAISIGLCSIIMWRVVKTGQTSKLITKSYDRKDGGMLGFMVVYILPIIRMTNSLTIWQYILYAIVIITIVGTMSEIGKYQYNPLLRFIRYKFYLVTDEDNLKSLLITKRTIYDNEEFTVKQIAQDIFIDTKGKN